MYGKNVHVYENKRLYIIKKKTCTPFSIFICNIKVYYTYKII